MPYKLQDGLLGYPPIESIISATAFAANGVGPSPGEIVGAIHKVWGGGEFIFGRANGSIRQYGLAIPLPVWDSTNKVYTYNITEAAASAGSGRPLCVAQNALSAGQYGYFQISGICPINSNANVGASAVIGIAASGQGGAAGAGLQVLNARNITASTNTVAKAGTGVSGDTVINVPDTDGFFLGGYMSGTGVGAAAIITGIDPMGKFITVSVANSADIAGTVTQTANNGTIFYNVAVFNRLFAQGQIT